MSKKSKKYLMYAAVAVGGYLVYRHFSKSDSPLPGTHGTIAYLPSLEAQAVRETAPMSGTITFLPSLEEAAETETDPMSGTMRPREASRYLGIQSALRQGRNLGERSRGFLSSQGFKLRGNRPTPADVYRHNVSVAGAVMGMLGSDCHTCDSPYNIAN